MAKCPVCKEFIDGYEWTPTKNGKKWLASSTGKWHDCPASQNKFSNTKYVKRIPLTDKDFDFCVLCSHMCMKLSTFEKHPNLAGLTLEEHKKQYHPNNEILDEIDFMVITDEEKEKTRIKWNQPKRTTQYKLNGKLVS